MRRKIGFLAQWPQAIALPEKVETYLPMFTTEFPGVRERVLDSRLVTDVDYPRVCTEYFRWHKMVSLYKVMGMPSKQVDEVLHAHLEYPEEYAAFCLKYFQGFHHHVPSKVDLMGKCSSTQALYPDFTDAYQTQFGMSPSKQIWVSGGEGCGGHHEEVSTKFYCPGKDPEYTWGKPLREMWPFRREEKSSHSFPYYPKR